MSHGKKIGDGSYANVYLSADGKVATKVIKYHKTGFVQMLVELNTLIRFKHPAIVKYMSHTLDNKALIIKMEACDHDLSTYVSKFGTPQPIVSRKWIIPIIHAVSFLNDNNYIHLDLKPANILVKMNSSCNPDEYELRLCDFGCGNYSRFETIIGHGTITCRPPENLLTDLSAGQKKKIRELVDIKHEDFSEQTDTFGLGVIWMYLLTSRYLLFPTREYDKSVFPYLQDFLKDTNKYIDDFYRKFRHYISQPVPEDDMKIIKILLEPSALKRIRVSDIINTLDCKFECRSRGFKYDEKSFDVNVEKFKKYNRVLITYCRESKLINRPETLCQALDMFVRVFFNMMEINPDIDEEELMGLFSGCIFISVYFFEEGYEDFHTQDQLLIIKVVEILGGQMVIKNPFTMYIRNEGDFDYVMDKYMDVTSYIKDPWVERPGKFSIYPDISDLEDCLNRVIISIGSHPENTDKTDDKQEGTKS